MPHPSEPNIASAYGLPLPAKARGSVRLSYFLPPPALDRTAEPDLNRTAEPDLSMLRTVARKQLDRLASTASPNGFAWKRPPEGEGWLSDDHRLSRRLRESGEVLHEACSDGPKRPLAFRLGADRIALFPIDSARLVDFRTGISSFVVRIELDEVRLAFDADFRAWAEAERELERLRAEGGEPAARQAASERMQTAFRSMARLGTAGEAIEFCYALGQSSRKGVDAAKGSTPDDAMRRPFLVEQVAERLFGPGSAAANPFFADHGAALEAGSGPGKVSRLVRPFLTACLPCGGPDEDGPRETAAFFLCRQFRRSYRVRDIESAGTASLDSSYSGRTFAYSPRGACAVLAPDDGEGEAARATAWAKAREPMVLVVRAELEYLLWELQRADGARQAGLPAYPQSFQPFWSRSGPGSGWWTTMRVMLGLAQRPETERSFDRSLEALEGQQKRLLEHRLYHQVVSASTEPEHESSFVRCRSGLGLERLERHADRASEEIGEYLEQVESRREASMQALFGRMGVVLAVVGLTLALTDVFQNAVPDAVPWKVGVILTLGSMASVAIGLWYRRRMGP